MINILLNVLLKFVFHSSYGPIRKQTVAFYIPDQ